jgi:hypothetical protein
LTSPGRNVWTRETFGHAGANTAIGKSKGIVIMSASRRLSGGVVAVVSCVLVTHSPAQASEQGWQRHQLPHQYARGEFYYTPAEYARGMAGYRGPYGYVFVPGHGILGEACNLPTSTCENQYRDVR